MNPTLLIFLVALGAVALFILGMSITLMVKGHHIKSEIGENEEMKKRGIKCTAQIMREEDAALRGEKFTPGDGCGDANCGSCSSVCTEK